MSIEEKKERNQPAVVMNEVIEGLIGINERLATSVDRLTKLSMRAGVYSDECVESSQDKIEPTDITGYLFSLLSKLRENSYYLENRITDIEKFI